MFWKILDFIKEFSEDKEFDRILDVGSRDINGSVRDVLSAKAEFLGIDMIDGKHVDIVMNSHDLSKKFPKNHFDLITCCETLEHDDKFWITVEEMKKVLKPGGWMLITVPGINFFKHDFPHDYYRFTEEAVKEMFKGFKDVHVEYYFDAADPNQEKPNNSVLAYGRKPE